MMSRMMEGMIGALSPEERQKLLLKMMPTMLEGESLYLIMDDSLVELSKRNRVSNTFYFLKEMLKRVTFYDLGSVLALMGGVKKSMPNNRRKDSKKEADAPASGISLNTGTADITEERLISVKTEKEEDISTLDAMAPVLEILMPKLMRLMMDGMMSRMLPVMKLMMPVMHKTMMPLMIKMIHENPEMNGVMVECMSEMCPQYLETILPLAPKEKRSGFGVNLVNKVKQGLTKDMSECERNEFNEKLK